MTDEDTPAVLRLQKVNEAVQEEMEEWDKNGIDFGAFGVHTINLDNQLWGLVEYLKGVIPNFDEFEFEYQWKSRYLVKVHELRKNVMAQQTQQAIVSGIVDANGVPLQVPKNDG